jgi:hypothetical protein
VFGLSGSFCRCVCPNALRIIITRESSKAPMLYSVYFIYVLYIESSVLFVCLFVSCADSSVGTHVTNNAT